uniref:Uncharacterized protein n=1 Tax=Glossina austeni TaxID=7395 RepID=A0A1A9UV62_GLOAU
MTAKNAAAVKNTGIGERSKKAIQDLERILATQPKEGILELEKERKRSGAEKSEYILKCMKCMYKHMHLRTLIDNGGLNKTEFSGPKQRANILHNAGQNNRINK